MFKFPKRRKVQPIIQGKPFDPYAAAEGYGYVAPPIGHEEFWSIECPYMTIRFAVPTDAWNKLEKSKEWIAFSKCLQECQKEYTLE